MATTKQKAAARKNVKKAAAAAKRKRTISHLPKDTRTALGEKANKVKPAKLRSSEPGLCGPARYGARRRPC